MLRCSVVVLGGVLLMAQAVKEDLSNFEDSGSAWPYLIDDFVDFMRTRKPLAA